MNRDKDFNCLPMYISIERGGSGITGPPSGIGIRISIAFVLKFELKGEDPGSPVLEVKIGIRLSIAFLFSC